MLLRNPLSRRFQFLVAAVLVLACLSLAVGIPAFRHWQTSNLLTQARLALDACDFSLAEARLVDYRRQRPADANGWLLSAQAARRAGRLEHAADFLEICQQSGGVTADTRFEWDLLRVQQGDLEEVEGRLRKSITPDHPQAPLALEALIKGFLKRDRLADALEGTSLWLSIAPDSAQALGLKGWAFERLGRRDDALEAYREAVERAPADRETRLRLAQLLLYKRKMAEAAGHFEKLLGQEDDFSPEIGLANCRLDAGQPEAACQLVKNALAVTPTPTGALVVRGRAALAAGRPADAAPFLASAVKQSPDDREALHQWARCLRDLHRDREAVVAEKQLALLTGDLKRLDELIRAVARQPRDLAARREAGAINLRFGNNREGIRWYYEALRVNPNDSESHKALAEHFEKVGNKEKAAFHRRIVAASGKGA
jgi:tetratricopeptide (TPR) repeat protein